jgi:predicted SnoaL-like aldol condensation-catalyzing enzyme
MKRIVCIAAVVFAAMLISANARAQSGQAPVNYPNKMEGKAVIACNFEADLIFGRKLDLADKYVTRNFGDHNVGFRTNDIPSFKEVLSKMPKFGQGQSGCGTMKIVIQQGDYVIFVRDMPVPDPHDSTKRVPGTHFDVYRFEGNKIAEHWD